MDFEWDEAKQRTNILKHGIDFVDAITIFAVASSRPWMSGAITVSGGIGRSGGSVMRSSRSHTRGGANAGGLSAPEGQDEMTEERITRVSLKQARRMKSLTDWARVNAMTEEEIERNAAEDPDNPPWTEEEWARARIVFPQGKEPVTLRLDRDILAWFKLRGRGYQTRINAVLRAFVEAQKQKG